MGHLSQIEIHGPYYVRYRDERPVAIVFRDLVISDKVSFTYSGMPGKAAARDLLERVHAIHAQLREEGATGPHLVSVILDGENLVFSFTFFGPGSNPWGSGSGLAVQALDVYADVDGAAGLGSRLLLPGRNAALPESQAWDVVVWAEGWTPGVYRVDEAGQPKPVSTEMKVAVDPVTRRVTIRVPRSALPEGDPATWGYLRQAQDDYWLSHWIPRCSFAGWASAGSSCARVIRSS